MKQVLTLATIGLFTATMSFAATLEELDSSGDGMVSMDEVMAVYPDVAAETFNAADTNADGMLDADELAAAQEAGLLPASDG